MKVSKIALAATLAISVAYAQDASQANNAAKDAKPSATRKLKKKTKKAAPAAKAKAQKTEALSAAPDQIKTSAASELSAPVNNVSESAAAPGLYKTLQDHVELSYWGEYRGAPLTDIGNKYQPNADGTIGDASAPEGAQSMENFVTVGYKPDKDTLFGVQIHSFYNAAPVSDANKDAVGSGLQMLDPILTVSRANLFNGTQFKVKGYLNSELPLTTGDYLRAQNRQMLMTLQPTANITYDFKNSRWSVGTYTFLRGYIPGPNTVAGPNSREYRFYIAPYANYQATSTLAATLWVDLVDFRHHSGSTFFSASGSVNEYVDIEPGFNWDVIPGKVAINPVVNIYPVKPTLSASSIMAVLTARPW